MTKYFVSIKQTINTHISDELISAAKLTLFETIIEAKTLSDARRKGKKIKDHVLATVVGWNGSLKDGSELDGTVIPLETQLKFWEARGDSTLAEIALGEDDE